MKLTLNINGELKDFYSRGITAGASLAAYDLMERIDLSSSNELYGKEHRESLLRFVVDLFNGQFTEQDFLEGCEDSFFSVVPGMLQSVVAGVSAKIKEFPKKAKAPEGTV